MSDKSLFLWFYNILWKHSLFDVAKYVDERSSQVLFIQSQRTIFYRICIDYFAWCQALTTKLHSVNGVIHVTRKGPILLDNTHAKKYTIPMCSMERKKGQSIK